MVNYWTGKGYGISDITDINGRPLLTYQGPEDKKPFLLSDRVAQTFDFTTIQVLTAGAMKNDRLDSSTASFIKTKLGGGKDDELDHKISLELGGSNTPANLFIQPGMTAGASAASDTLENSLALDVVTGKISLLTAWRTLADQKNFLLGEDSKIGTTFTFPQIFAGVFEVLKATATSVKSQQLSAQSKALTAQMLSDIEKLKQDPLNQKLQNQIFGNNVKNAQEVLSVTGAEAQKVTKSFIGAYGTSKGVDPREMMGALNLNIQQIIDNSKNSPNIFGIPTALIIKIVGVLQSVSTGAVTLGIILAIVGIFLAGPEAILGALSGGLLESIGAIFGVSALTGIGLTLFAFGETMTVASIGLGMTVKQTYDNVYLLPTQQISSLKEALAIQKGLAGFLPSESSTTTTTGTKTGTSGTTKATSTPTVKVFTGIVSQGVIGTGLVFTPRQDDLIETADELKVAAVNNLSTYLNTLLGKIVYEIKIVSSVTGANGFKQTGTAQKIQTGTTKAGTPTYKTVVNKFATLIIYAVTDKGSRAKLNTIVLGPVNSAKLVIGQNDLQNLQNQLPALTTTTDVSQINTIVSNTPISVTSQTPASTTATITSMTNVPTTNTPTAPTQTTTTKPTTTTQTTAPTQTRTPTAPAAPTVKPGANATTLSDWYAANGLALPSLSARATAYQTFGLGQASYYTGTAEQNLRLLNQLKAI